MSFAGAVASARRDERSRCMTMTNRDSTKRPGAYGFGSGG